MKVLANLQLIPMGTGISVSEYIAECERILADAGLQYELHANGTNIEGEWDAVFTAVRQCHERVHGMGAPRIQTLLSIGTRTDRDQSLVDKVEAVNRRLGD
ncbi:MAG TPA: MTH1187 family thiamine-binding protein [Gammaproteobacteria bacterium]|nr:MTH1187 family thiamine-binding protein [Gammaproteobacteria bacterium]